MTSQARPDKTAKTTNTAKTANAKQEAKTNAPTALITGASSGIGEALALCFAEAGYQLILVARSTDKLQDLSQRLAAEHDATGT